MFGSMTGMGRLRVHLGQVGIIRSLYFPTSFLMPTEQLFWDFRIGGRIKHAVVVAILTHVGIRMHTGQIRVVTLCVSVIRVLYWHQFMFSKAVVSAAPTAVEPMDRDQEEVNFILEIGHYQQAYLQLAVITKKLH